MAVVVEWCCVTISWCVFLCMIHRHIHFVSKVARDTCRVFTRLLFIVEDSKVTGMFARLVSKRRKKTNNTLKMEVSVQLRERE